MRLVAPLDQLPDDRDPGGAQQLPELCEIARGKRADEERALLGAADAPGGAGRELAARP